MRSFNHPRVGNISEKKKKHKKWKDGQLGRQRKIGLKKMDAILDAFFNVKKPL